MIKDYLKEILIKACEKSGFECGDINFDKPKDKNHGDLSTNFAFVLGKKLKVNPKTVAEKITGHLNFDKTLIEKFEIAGPGFVNFFLSDWYCKKILNVIISAENDYGRSDINSGKTANIEWVSANPTGPLHAGHGRQVCLGKAVARLLEWTGCKVTREYYYNDAGNQMNNLGKSVYARYMQKFNPDFPFPDDGYHGDYIKTIAEMIFDEKNDSLINSSDIAYFIKKAEEYNFNLIKNTLEKLGVKHDNYFNETSLYKSGAIEIVIGDFKRIGLAYENEGALWLKMDEKEGFQKDKVIVKASGEPTYRLPDIAYHIDKLKRNYDIVLDIFGSDHGDTYKEVLYGVKSLGFDSGRIHVIIHQMVTFKEGDQLFKMSKRSDKTYSLDDLIDDIGADATQFFFVMRSANTHLDFDISLAKDKSEKNPVYYLQYAHARIAGILRNAEENFPRFRIIDVNDLNLELIVTDDEINLLKTLSEFPEEVLSASKNYEPHRIITYLNDVAEKFHRFYHNNRVIDLNNRDLSLIRIYICIAVKQVLKNGFDIIGISAPERM